MSWLARLLAMGMLSLVAVTWKLWTPQQVFPQVPLIRAACDWPGWLDWSFLVILVTCSLGLGGFAHIDRIRRATCVGMSVSLAGFFVLDQHRLQPWAWQFLLLSIVLSLANDATSRRCWIGLVISIYFWSAVSKLDYTFCHVQGPALLSGIKKAIGLRVLPNRWTETLDVYGSLAIAMGELAVALLLMWPRTRRIGCWGATLMHLMLLTALGPWGLRHSYGVLTWNVYFIIQNWLLFWPNQGTDSVAEVQRGSDWLRGCLLFGGDVRNQIAGAVIAIAVLWPAFEPWGLCDHWLAWAVYSARPGAVDVVTSELTQIQILPIRTESYSSSTGMVSKLNIGQWSLDALGVPVYPEQRFHLGIVWWLKERFGFEGTVLLWEPPDRLSGRRAEAKQISVGQTEFDEFEKKTESFRWNARPRRKTN